MAVGQTFFEHQLGLAEEGNAKAQYSIGLMYMAGENVPVNNSEAARWYRAAADQGHADAQFSIGFMYTNGAGVPKNDTEAVKWYSLASMQGHVASMTNLATKYLAGEVVPQNFVIAYAWWNVAAAYGEESSLDLRDGLVGLMTPAQIAEGQQLSTEIFERIQGNQ
jgi:TPR repeat protein